MSDIFRYRRNATSSVQHGFGALKIEAISKPKYRNRVEIEPIEPRPALAGKGIGQQGIGLKHRNFFQKEPTPCRPTPPPVTSVAAVKLTPSEDWPWLFGRAERLAAAAGADRLSCMGGAAWVAGVERGGG